MRTVMSPTMVCLFVSASTPAKSISFGSKGTRLGELVEPAGFTLDGVQHGIASKYVRDEGLQDDPDVILFENFEVESLSALDAKGWVPRHGPGLWTDGTGEKLGWKYYEISAEPGNAFAGKGCPKKYITSIASDLNLATIFAICSLVFSSIFSPPEKGLRDLNN